jgi:hypothetical protein
MSDVFTLIPSLPEAPDPIRRSLGFVELPEAIILSARIPEALKSGGLAAISVYSQ